MPPVSLAPPPTPGPDDTRVAPFRAVTLVIGLAWVAMATVSLRLERPHVATLQIGGAAMALTVRWLATRVGARWFPRLVHAFIALALGVALAVNVLRPPEFNSPLLTAIVAPPIASYLLGARSGVFWTVAAAVVALISAPLVRSGVLPPEGTMRPGEVVATVFVIHGVVAVTAIAARRATVRQMAETTAAAVALRQQTIELEQTHARVLAASNAKSQFLGTMSHELRTPLNGVLGMASLLLDSPLDARQRELVRTLHDSGEALLGILNDVLDTAKLELGRMDIASEPFDLRACIGQVVALFAPVAEARGLSVTVRVDDAVPSVVRGDDVRLRQMLSNLIGNAVKFTERGRVAVRVTRDAGTADGVRIEVVDSGIGIPEDRLELIFAPFTQADATTTRRFGGTGLGLTIVRDLATRMNGRVWATSRPGAGSTFTLVLPLPSSAPRPPLPEQAPTPAPEGPTPPLRVLVVDDQAVNLQVVRLMLEQAGHAVDVVDGGAAAVALARRRLYDVVLTDVHMPDMDGFEVSRGIREALSPAWQPYIVALTANAFHERVQAYADAGMDFLAKPVRPASLNAVLSRADASRVAVDGASAAAFRRLGAGDPAVPRGALEAFFDSTEALVGRVARAREARDLPELARASHAIAGNAAGVGAFGLARAAAATERAAREADPARASDCAAAIAELWPRARVAIEGVLGTGGPADPSASVDTPAARV